MHKIKYNSIHPSDWALKTHICRNMTSGNSGTIISETTCDEINQETYQIRIPGPYFGSMELESLTVDSRNSDHSYQQVQ